MAAFTHGFRILGVTVILTRGPDHIIIDIDAPSPFPETGYSPKFKMEARPGYGIPWCKAAFGFDPDVIDARATTPNTRCSDFSELAPKGAKP